MKRMLFTLAAAALATNASAVELATPSSTFGRLDHVFLIMMENQTNTDILGNPNTPFINSYAHVANQATNYFAVGHPSAPNYLEIVGGSNFGVSNDFWPNWVNTGCVDNAPGSTGCVGAFTPIASSGHDNAVVATATNSSQCNGQITIPPGATPAPNNRRASAATRRRFLRLDRSRIRDWLPGTNHWKTYQEESANRFAGRFWCVNYADGAFSNLSPSAVFAPSPIQKLYAVKHDPFAYFRNIEVGKNSNLSLAQVVDFDGPNGLWADLQSNAAPNFSVIVPNQCHDMHGGVSGGTPICSSATTAERALLLSEGDAQVAKLVNGIKASPSWNKGRNAIVLVWDENDYSNAPNRVVMLVETSYGPNGRASSQPYDHFSLLKTLEAGFGLPCLNHACDATSVVMEDLFGGE